MYTQRSDDSGASSIGLAYKDNHRSKILRRRKGLHAVCMRKLASQVANVEYHGQLAELIACRMKSGSKLHVLNIILNWIHQSRTRDTCIFLQSHHIGIVDERLIQVLCVRH